MYRVIINDCPIAVGVEKPHKFSMYRQPRNVRQTSRQISTTTSSATYRRYQSHSCYEACGTFNYVTNVYCDGTLIYNDPIHTELFTNNNGPYKRNRLYIFRVCRSRIRCSLVRIKPKKPPNKPHGAYKPWFLFEHSKFLG
jgi:hypothetical protein